MASAMGSAGVGASAQSIAVGSAQATVMAPAQAVAPARGMVSAQGGESLSVWRVADWGTAWGANLRMQSGCDLWWRKPWTRHKQRQLRRQWGWRRRWGTGQGHSKRPWYRRRLWSWRRPA